MASILNSDSNQSARESETLIAALGYLKRGWPVIPLEPRGKRPLIEWSPYQQHPPSEQDVRDWWKQWPDANVGIVTGAVSGIVALDIDGEQGSKELNSRGLVLPDTPTSRTAKGRHVFFAHPGFPIPNAVAIIPNVDLRGDGGYVVAPPSVHPTGMQYAWMTRPDDAPLAIIPAILADLITQRGKEGNGNGTLASLAHGVPRGERNADTAILVGSLIARYSEDDWEEVCWPLVEAWNSQNVPPLSTQELRRVFQSITGRERRRRAVAGHRLDGTLPLKGIMTPDARPLVITLSEVSPTKVRWLWKSYIPLGKMTVLDGDPDLGKSLFSLDLASRVSTGRTMPDDSTGDLAGPRGVVLLTAEDDLGDTVRPRLDLAGADTTKIRALTSISVGGTEQIVTLNHIEAIEEAIQDVDAALVVVDPLMAYLPAASDSHRDQDVRRILAPLAALASRTGAAVLVVRHLNKTGNGNPIYRGGGSIGIIGAARSGLLVAKDPDDPDSDIRILAVTKSNLSAKPSALAYRIEGVDGVARIRWLGATDHTPEILVAAVRNSEDYSALGKAKQFLEETLQWGPKSAAKLIVEARKAGISEKTLRRAKAELRIDARKDGFSGGWTWEFPPKMATTREDDQALPRGPLAPYWPSSTIPDKPSGNPTPGEGAE